MATTEQFSLRWNNFHSNLTSGFHELLEAAEMVDVTLAVEGHFLQAHKIVLSICSPYFKQMFKANPCKHPIVIIKDVSHENMKDILEFMYMGEVSVLRDNLTQFLRTAELLQVKGLTGDDSGEDAAPSKENKSDCDNIDESEMYSQMIESDVELPVYPQPATHLAPPKRAKHTNNCGTNAKRPKSDSLSQQTKAIKQEFEPVRTKNETNSDNSETAIAENANTVGSLKPVDIDDSKEPINMKMVWDNSFSATSSADLNISDQGRAEKTVNKNPYQCGQCMKKFSRRDHLKTHVKNIHGEFAGPFKCVICSQLYKNTESLRKHIAKFHFTTINDTIQRIEVNA